MSSREPYLSVVAASRNDDHGKNLLQRMQIFASGFITQCQRFQLPAELILVDWNPPVNKPPLSEAITWPEQNDYCTIRIIQVPPELHAKFQHSEKMPMFQMIAKNVGIRRARGEFILATNIDLLFSDELMQFLAARQLRPGTMYRINRYDVSENVPVNASISEQLTFCAQNIIRINARRTTVTTPEPGPILYVPSPTELFVSTRPHWQLQAYCWLFERYQRAAHKITQVRQWSRNALSRNLFPVKQPLKRVDTTLRTSQHAAIALPRRVWKKTRRAWRSSLAPASQVHKPSSTSRQPLIDHKTAPEAAYNITTPRHSAMPVQSPLGLPAKILGMNKRLDHLYDVARWPHLNACGDFTLMARQDWFKLRGYPELEIFSMHIDSLLCCTAELSGIRELILYEPFRLYHIEHGGGYTPEGWDAVVRRMDADGLPYLTIKDFEGVIMGMRRHPAQRIPNSEQWGLAQNQLNEKVLP